jgi:para-nitrobenzyl esterase
MNKFLLYIFCNVLMLQAFAQCGNRYLEDISTSFIKHEDIIYGSNLDNKNQQTELLLDVYEPAEDTLSLRPLMIFVHGGSFVGGSRTDQDIDKIAQYFAKKGYVTANIEYRVEQTNFISPFVNFADKDNWYKAIIRVVHDINASIRYLKKTVAEDANIYRIDTNQIILYGSSAGAIGALHATLIDNLDEASADFKKNFVALGGLEGNSGHPNYTSRNTVKAIVSCSGAVDNVNYLSNNKDLKLIAFHHAVDLTVPYDKGCFISVACFLNQYYGSKQIVQKAKSVGITHEFYTFNKIDHPADKVANPEDRSFLIQKTTEFLYNNVVECEDRITAIKQNKVQSFKTYPNPAKAFVIIENDKSLYQKEINLQISNALGVVVFEQKLLADRSNQVSINFPSGMYVAKIYALGDDKVYTSKFMVE